MKHYERSRVMRIEAYKNSELPQSFDYKIRWAFENEKCPVCGFIMNNNGGIRSPTVQHNIPLSKGGKHELSNISVICKQCNITIKDNEILINNTVEVIKKWEEVKLPKPKGRKRKIVISYSL